MDSQNIEVNGFFRQDHGNALNKGFKAPSDSDIDETDSEEIFSVSNIGAAARKAAFVYKS